jgi:peptide-methionine (S)-S-oxide reductase
MGHRRPVIAGLGRLVLMRVRLAARSNGARDANRMTQSRGGLLGALAALCVLATACGVPNTASMAREHARSVPLPTVDEAGSPLDSEVAVLAGGCFWGVQAVFQHVAGVTEAVSGYAGGARETAQYDLVSSGTTGHAESVQVTFDPRQISFGRILQIYFSVAHDPTQLDRQGPDIGPQYRSAIFPTSAEQARVARAYIDQLQANSVFDAPMVTRIEPDRAFYPAEAYHQDFLERHPDHPYIVINDLPKIANLQQTEPDVYRSQPVLVGAS